MKSPGGISYPCPRALSLAAELPLRRQRARPVRRRCRGAVGPGRGATNSLPPRPGTGPRQPARAPFGTIRTATSYATANSNAVAAASRSIACSMAGLVIERDLGWMLRRSSPQPVAGYGSAAEIFPKVADRVVPSAVTEVTTTTATKPAIRSVHIPVPSRHVHPWPTH